MRIPEPAETEIEEGEMVTGGSIEQYLREIQIPLRLSRVSISGWPVVLSLWYLY